MWFNPAKIEKFQHTGPANFANPANPENEISRLAKLATGEKLKVIDCHSEISKLARLAGEQSARICAGDVATEVGIAHRAWLIHFTDRDTVEVYCAPPATHAEVLERHPDAVAAESFTPTIRQPSTPMAASEEMAIRAWLALIEETDPVTIAEVISRCQRDADARDYFTGRATAELPKSAPLPDDRRTCNQCINLRQRACAIAKPEAEALVVANRGYRPDPARLLRCVGFAPMENDLDQRPGEKRWLGLTNMEGTK
jgi:hypothetical protein